MSEKTETKPDAVEETKPAGQELAKPEGREDPTPEPSRDPQNEPSRPKTLEEYEAALAERDKKLAEVGTKVDDLVKGMNEAQRKAAEAQQQAGQYQSAFQQLFSEKQQAADPLQAAQQRWLELKNDPYADPNEEAQAQLEVWRQMQQQTLQNSVRLGELNWQARQAREQWGYDQQQLANVLNKAQTDPILAAKLAALDDGSYDEKVAKDRAAREAAAENAKFLAGLKGAGSEGLPPGGGRQQKSPGYVPWNEFAAMDEGYQKELLEQGVIVTGAPPELVDQE